MSSWPKHPVLYEINTWAWLDELRRRAGRRVTLGDVPQEELVRLAGRGFDAVWLMGVWERSPAGRRIAREHEGLQAEYGRALPDWTKADVAGSPYAVHAYRVDPNLGADEELAHLRERLRSLGLPLVLDFVPNHLAVDHPWCREHPERLVEGRAEDLAGQPGTYFASGEGKDRRVLAHGRDPYFPAWSDTVQIDYRRRSAREAMAEMLAAVASRCDGVRCDMAMLVTREVFLRTWGGRFDVHGAEFWPEAIARVKEKHPDCLVLAEVYWGMEWELLGQGFDFAYDKVLYDRLLHDPAASVREYLAAHAGHQPHLCRFVENHDEGRAAAVFGLARSRAAAALTLTLPGLRLLHEGQLEGRRAKLPVQLGRRPGEPIDGPTEQFYGKLLEALRHPVFHEDDWQLLQPEPISPGSTTHAGVVAHQWTAGDECRVVAVNLGPEPAECVLPLQCPNLAGRGWTIVDLLGEDRIPASGDELADRRLPLKLDGYGYRLLSLKPQLG